MHYFLLMVSFLFVLVVLPLQYSASFFASFILTPLLVSFVSESLLKVSLSFWAVLKGMFLSVVFLVAGAMLLHAVSGGIHLAGLGIALFLVYIFAAMVLAYKLASGLNFIASAIVALLSITLNTVVVGAVDAIFAV